MLRMVRQVISCLAQAKYTMLLLIHLPTTANQSSGLPSFVCTLPSRTNHASSSLHLAQLPRPSQTVCSYRPPDVRAKCLAYRRVTAGRIQFRGTVLSDMREAKLHKEVGRYGEAEFGADVAELDALAVVGVLGQDRARGC